MAVTVNAIKCPGCGAPLADNQKTCDWCRAEVFIRSYETVAAMPAPQLNKYALAYKQNLVENPDHQELNESAAFCFLKLSMYDDAYNAFSKALVNNFDNSEVFFYAAVSLLKGKKAFLHTRPEIDKMLELINAALMIEPKGIYHYFMAYLKHDYFKRKFLTTTPNYKDCLVKAQAAGCTKADIDLFYAAAGVDPVNMV